MDMGTTDITQVLFKQALRSAQGSRSKEKIDNEQIHCVNGLHSRRCEQPSGLRYLIIVIIFQKP